jgi:hypothetical protein
MKKWTLSAMIYLLVVVGAYYAYDAFAGPPAEEVNHTGEQLHHQ